MAKKRYFKKKAVLTAIGRYQRRKLNYITDFYWNSDGNLFIDGQQRGGFNIGEAFTGNSNEYLSLSKQFGFVKLRGILIEVDPVIVSGYDFAISIGNTNDSLIFGNLRTQPNVLLIDTHNKSRMYHKINSQFIATNANELFNNFALFPFRQGTGAGRFSLKITLYLTFKTNL